MKIRLRKRRKFRPTLLSIPEDGDSLLNSATSSALSNYSMDATEDDESRNSPTNELINCTEYYNREFYPCLSSDASHIKAVALSPIDRTPKHQKSTYDTTSNEPKNDEKVRERLHVESEPKPLNRILEAEQDPTHTNIEAEPRKASPTTEKGAIKPKTPKRLPETRSNENSPTPTMTPGTEHTTETSQNINQSSRKTPDPVSAKPKTETQAMQRRKRRSKIPVPARRFSLETTQTLDSSPKSTAKLDASSRQAVMSLPDLNAMRTALKMPPNLQRIENLVDGQSIQQSNNQPSRIPKLPEIKDPQSPAKQSDVESLSLVSVGRNLLLNTETIMSSKITFIHNENLRSMRKRNTFSLFNKSFTTISERYTLKNVTAICHNVLT